MDNMNNKTHFSSLLPLLLVGAAGLAALTGCVTKSEVKETSLIENPKLDKRLVADDFTFPSRPPRLEEGQKIYQQNCATCHTSSPYTSEELKNVRPIDTYLLLARNEGAHAKLPEDVKNALRDKLTRDNRWEAVFYVRYLAGGSLTDAPKARRDEIAAIFGSNCAVCHGTKGFADGPLYTGHASAHELGMAPVKNQFIPPPANFHSYSRMYNRTDADIFKFIAEGVYPSAMPSWKGRVDKEKGVTFDDQLIWDLVKHVRGFAFEDLPEEQRGKKPAGQAAGKEISAVIPSSNGQLEESR